MFFNRFSQDFMEESIARTNQFFGGLRPNVYRVFFTHGEMDPRHQLGPNEDLNYNAPAVVMSRKLCKLSWNFLI